MKNLEVQTTQNIAIQYRIASIGERLLATLLDIAIIMVYFFFLSIVGEGTSFGNEPALVFIAFIPVFVYHLLSELFMNGQSFGKKVMKIKVVKLDGSEPSIGNYFVRWMFRIIDINISYGSVAIITVAVNGKGQRLGDIVAKTSVISTRHKERLEDTIYEKTTDDYLVTYDAVKFLDDKDIKTVKRVIKHYHKNISKPAASELLRKTARIIEQKTGVTAKENPGDFLRTIVKDYSAVYK